MGPHSAEQNPEVRRFLFLLASARLNGNTEWLARIAATTLPASTETRWICLSDMPLAPFRDIRHDGSMYPAPQGHEQALADATVAATDLVFVAPLYWYSVPASAKLYLDYWSGWMRVESLEFKRRMKDKRLWTITVISDAEDALADPLIGTLRQTANYLQMKWCGALIGHGNRPGDVERDKPVIEMAATFFHQK